MQLRLQTPNGITTIQLGQSPAAADGALPTGVPGAAALQILAGWGHGSTAGLGGADWVAGCGVFRGETYRMGPSFSQEANDKKACQEAGISRICSPSQPFGVWQFPWNITIPKLTSGRVSLTLPIAGRLFAYEVCARRVPVDAENSIVESMFLANLVSASAATYRLVWPADAPTATLTAANVVSNLAVAGADLTVTLQIAGVAVTGGVITVPVGAAGVSGSATPTSNNVIAPGQTLLVTIGGGNTTANSNGSLNLNFEAVGASEHSSGCGCEDCGGDCSLVSITDWRSRQITNTYPGLGRETGFTPTGGSLAAYDPNRETASACKYSAKRLLNGQNFLPPWVPNVDLKNGNDELSWLVTNTSPDFDIVLEQILHIKYGSFDLEQAIHDYCEQQAACAC